MAAKIKDGLFIGDAETSQSEVFINDNKISNLINLSGREVNNIWAPHGLVYLTYFWEDRPDYKILNTHEDSMLKDIVEFIDVSISHGISVLLFSSHGTGRCAIAACIYLMMKYRWGFEKTYDYVYSKKPDINLNKGFIQQMFALDMKLLSARQKSFALKYPGSSSITDSGFKIEANMTINDISAMLPPNEAKRWNAWEPDYITGGDIKNSNSILLLSSSSKDHYLDERKEYDAKSDYKRLSSSSSSRNKHANVTPGQQSSSAVTAAAVVDVEAAAADELLLVYSFLNSKNTITSLPGPYPDIYDIPKSFKIRFNSICFEEDVNWFPPVVSLPNNSRNSNHHHHMSNNSNSSSSNNKVGLPRSALKGSRNKEKQMMMLSINSDSSVVPNTAQPKTSSKHNHASFDSGASSKQLSSHGSNNSSNSVDFKSIYPEENIATISMNMNNNQRRERSNSSNNNNNNYNNQQLSSMRSSSQQQQQQQISNDLYEFVGITNTDPARSRANRGSRGSGTRGSRELIAASTDHHLDIDDVDESSLLDIDLPPNNSSNNNNNNSTRNHHTETTAAGSSSSHSNNNKNNSNKFNNSVTAEERLRNLMTDMQRHKPTASSSSSGGDNDVSASGSSNNYHHHHHNSVAGPSLYELATMKLPTSGLQSSKGMMNGAMAMDTRLQMADYGMDELLYAFDQQQQLHNSATAGSNNSNSSSNKANVIRARHDIVTHRSNQNSNNNSNSSNNNNQYHNHSSGSSSNNGTRSNASSPVMTRPSPKSAWGGQGSVGPININPKTALPGSSSRPGSPSPGQTSSQPGGAAYPTPNPTHSSSSSNNNNNHIPSRYSSPSSSSARSNNNMTSGAAAAAANSSNLSINSLNSNASGSNNVVGSGMNSATKVYRSVAVVVQ